MNRTSAVRSQLDLVRELLSDRRWHSTIEFVELGVLRAPARMHELRRGGLAIETMRVARMGRSPIFAYRLAPVEQMEFFS